MRKNTQRGSVRLSYLKFRLQRLLVRMRLRRKALRIASVLILLAVIEGTFLLFFHPAVQAAWFDDNYSYRQLITFTHNAAITTDRRITITVDTATLITNGKMQSDCDDTRFTDLSGKKLRYQLTGSCNNASTTYDVVFPAVYNSVNNAYIYYGNPSATSESDANVASVTSLSPSGGAATVGTEEKSLAPLLNWKFDEGYGTTAHDASSNANNGTISATGSNAPAATKIDDSANFGAMQGQGRQLVRTSTGTLYTAISTSTSCRVYKSTNGSSWTEQDAANHITCAGTLNAAIDANDNIHIVYLINGGSQTNVGYVVFSTATDTYGSTSTAVTSSFGESLTLDGIAVDANNAPHIIYTVNPGGTLKYRNKVGGSWNTIINTGDAVGAGTPSITIDANNIPEISDVTSGAGLGAFIGNANNPSVLTKQVIDSTVSTGGTYSTSIVIDANNNTWIAYTDETGATDFLKLVKHTAGAVWSAWQAPVTDSHSGTEPMIAVNGTDLYMFYQNSANDVAYDMYNGSTWSGETTLETGTYQDVKPKWSQLHNFYGTTQIDYLYSDNTDVYWHELDLAGATPGIEQQINIINQTYTNSTTTFAPSDNSLGLMHWDSAKYPGATIYFEAIVCSNIGNGIATVQLHDAAGNAISGATVSGAASSCVSPDPVIIRSSAITLTDNTDYTVRLKRGGLADTVRVLAARLIVVQTDTTKITDTQTQVEVGSNQTTSSTTDVQLTDKKIYHYDTAGFNPSPTVYFEATLSNTTGGQTAIASLYTDGASCSSQVSGSAVTVTGTTWTRQRSSAITLVSGTDYMVCIKAGANTAQIANAKIIIDQSSASGITETQLVHTGITTVQTQATSTYTSKSYYNTYDLGNFIGGTVSDFFETTIKTSAGTGFAQLYDFSNTTAVASSEASTTSTSYVRKRSEGVTAALSSSNGSTLETQLKNSSTNTTSVASSALLIQVSGLSNGGAGGTAGASPTWQANDRCLIGKCIQFSSGYVSKTYASDTELDPGTGSFTASAWFKHGNTISSTETILARADGVNGVGYKLYMNASGFICFGIDSAAGSFPSDSACSTTSYADSNWHMVEGIKSTTSSITLFIDGKQIIQDTSITGTTISGTSSPFFVGADADGSSNLWTGSIDEVKYYNFAKTTPQILLDFTARGGVLGAASSAGDKGTTFLNQGLVGYWKMDDNTGTTTVDSSGNNITGTLTNGPTWGSGKFGNGITFDGTNDYIDVTSSNLSFGAGSSFSISGWFKTSTTGTRQGLYGVNSASGQYIAVFVYTDNTLTLETNDSNGSFIGASSTTTVTDGTWHHYVAERDASDQSIKLYLDGTLVERSADTRTGDFTSTANYIGRDQSSFYMNGSIDDTRIYNRALSASEISSLYEWAPDPVGYWKMDEGSGTTTADISGNNNLGTLTNGPRWTNGKFGKALLFDGTDDNIDLGTDSSIAPSTTFTGEAWINQSTAASGVNTIFASGSNDLQNWSMDISATGKLDIRLDNNTSFPSSSSVSKGVWHHVAVVKNGDSGVNASLYIDGVLDTTASVGSLTTSTGTKAIGWRPEISGEAFNGVIDEVKVYNYARTNKQIVSDMNGGHPGVGSPVGSALGYWRFDEGYGTSAHNTGSDYNNGTGTLTNMATGSTASGWVNGGKFGKAIGFDGANDYISMGNPSSAQITSDLSLSAWVRLAATNANQDIIAKRGAVNQWGYRLWVDSSGTPTFDLSQDGSRMATVSASTTLTANTWYHLVGTFATSSAMTIYVNGVQKGQITSSLPTAVKNSSANLNVGGENSGASNLLNGTLDEIKLYNYALNATDVKVEYNQGKSSMVGSLSINADGTTASNSAARSYCPPGNSEANCATSSDASPIGEWKLDEHTGTTSNDSSGNGSTCTFTSFVDTGWATGKVGSAVNFDGVDSRLDCGNASILQNIPAGGGFTASAWIYPRTNGEGNAGRILVKDDTGPANGWQFRMNSSNQLEFEADFDGATDLSVFSTTALNLNAWQYITVTWDGSLSKANVHLYSNGIEMTQSGSSTNGVGNRVSDAAKNLIIGNGQTGTRTFDGYIDNVTIYNYIRTPSQIAWDYNRGAPVGWWKFDECNGTTLNDASGNGNNGTWTGSGSTQTSIGTCSTASTAWGNGATGKFGSSLNFDGGDDRITLATNNAYDNLTTGTITAWIKAVSGSNGFHDIFTADTSGGCTAPFEFSLDQTSASTAQFELYIDNNACGPDLNLNVPLSNPFGTWHHLAYVVSSTGNQVYVDGNLASPNYTTGTSANAYFLNYTSTGTTQYAIGDWVATGELFKGQIDDLRIYSYPLTGSQIKTVYNEGTAVRFGP